MRDNFETRTTPDWLRPQLEQGGLSHYVQVVRERILIVIAAFVIVAAFAIAYLLTAENVYEGTADLIVAPVSTDDPLLASLVVIRASSDPTRDVETAARLVESLDVAELVRKDLGFFESARSLVNDVSAEPVAQSNVVAVTARGSTPEGAASLANAFAEGVGRDRTEEFHKLVESRLEGLQASTPTDETQADIARLEGFLTEPDPTIRLETAAVAIDSAVSPKPLLTVVAAGLAGLVLGLGAAFGAQTLDPRLRREEQLRSRYKLPILARVPRETARRKNQPLPPGTVSMATQEAYRALRANLAVNRTGDHAQSILITGSSPSEGKTTTALHLAASFALAGNRVILIEADLRRPSIATAMGAKPRHGVVGALLENVSLSEALLSTNAFGPNLELLLADQRGEWMGELFSLRTAERLMNEATALADYVIIDSPPLTAVVDTLPLARQVDDVVIVTRIGVTRLDKLQELSELLASNHIDPVGFALLGAPRPEGSYYYTERDRSGEAPQVVVSAAAEAERRERVR